MTYIAPDYPEPVTGSPLAAVIALALLFLTPLAARALHRWWA